MRKFLARPLVVVAVAFSIVSCGTLQQEQPSGEQSGTPRHSILGTWKYEEHDGDNVTDEGTITFSGNGSAGAYTLVNYYEYDYEGTYRLDGERVILTGTKEWTGRFVDGDHIKGSWHDEGKNGTWRAERTGGGT